MKPNKNKKEKLLAKILLLFWCRCPVAVPKNAVGLTLFLGIFDRYHSLNSLHLPPAALVSLPGVSPPVLLRNQYAKTKVLLREKYLCFLVPVTGVARLRTERWSALTATGSHSLPTLRPRSSINIQNKKEKLLAKLLFLVLVPVTGVEPVQCFHRRILSPLRLPVPPHRQFCANILYSFGVDLSTEN